MRNTLTKEEFYNLIQSTSYGSLLLKSDLEKKYSKKYPGLRKGAVGDQLSRFTASGHLEYLGRPGVYRPTHAYTPKYLCRQIRSYLQLLEEMLHE